MATVWKIILYYFDVKCTVLDLYDFTDIPSEWKGSEEKLSDSSDATQSLMAWMKFVVTSELVFLKIHQIAHGFLSVVLTRSLKLFHVSETAIGL